MGEPYQRQANARCLVCSTSMYRRPAEIERNGNRLFCSSACFGIASRKDRACKICGNRIGPGINRVTCSRACANRHRAGIQYKTGRRKDKVKDQRMLKLRLLETRGSKCERCGYAKVEILHIHHRDRNRQNSSLENLELICPNCHYEEHYLEKSWLNGKVHGDTEGSDSGSFQRT